VDDEDSARAKLWFGDAREAPRACGVRELAEEAGVLSTAQGLVAAPGDREGDSGGAGPEHFSDFPGGAPRVEQLPEISHWVAPEDVPVRFDARFFAVAAPRGLEPVPDGGEAVRAWWARPFDLLEANDSGGCLLYWPTMKVIEGLARCSTVDEVLETHIPQIESEGQVI